MKAKGSWSERYKKASENAEKIVAQSKASFPVDLSKIAALAHIQRIQFRPMLVEGALGILKDGFEAFIRCQTYEQQEFNDLFSSSGDCRLLPRKAINRTRFTIAHEIAHACFYEYKSGRYQMPFIISNVRTKEALERACNRLAGAILLPEKLLQNYFKSNDSLSPDVLAKIAEVALVAKQSLLIRLEDLQRSIQPFGVVACIKATNCAVPPVIQSVWRNYAFDREWPQVCIGTAINALCGHPDWIVNSGDLYEVDDVIKNSIGDRQTWRFSVQHQFSRASGSFFVTAFPLSFK